jgi:flagellar assembly protein FliH
LSSNARRIVGTGGAEPFVWDRVEGAGDDAVFEAQLTPSPHDAAEDPARLAALEREAFTKGYAQGERAGAEAAAKRGDAMLRRLHDTLEELTMLRAEMMRQTERQLVQLALAIAARIIHREISLDRGLLVAMARVAIDRLGEQASATIRLNPEDYAAAAASGDPAWQSEQVRVIADPLVNRGGCLVQSDFGTMDIGLDSQFRELARAVLGDPETDPAAVRSREANGVSHG